MNTITLQAPAKVNLRLVVLGRESSGFHALETLFCAISLADDLTFERGGKGIDLHVDGEVDAGPLEANLVMRAARKFYRELNQPAAVRIRLRKEIPAEAGLGGGSSDAATTLMALNLLHGAPFSPEQLLAWGGQLGSDVPFFLCGSPLALAWSRGERLLPLDPLPARHVLVAKPSESIPTAAAFAGIAESRGDRYPAMPAILNPESLCTWAGIQSLAINDFEDIAFERIPILRTAADALRSAGMTLVLLAGSGSAIFGVSDSAEIVEGAAEVVSGLGLKIWRGHTLQNGLNSTNVGRPAG